jgi:uncharacterized protein
MHYRFGALALLLLSAANAQAELPVAVQSDLWDAYGSPSKLVRYREGRVDLDGNGREEIVVYLSGRKTCARNGCTTVVYSPQGKDGYRRVATIAATDLPIGVAEARSAGWRDLVVHVRGHKKGPVLELFFDGTTYPKNPHARDPLIVPAKDAGAVIIAASDDASGGELLTKPVVTSVADTVDAESLKASRKQSDRRVKVVDSANAPSFKCALAMQNTEKLICASPELAALDREVAASLATETKGQSEERAEELRSDQHNWTTVRNGCGTTPDPTSCIRESYRRRLVALQIRQGSATPSPATTYACDGQKQPLSAVVYKTDPQAIVLTWGKREAMMYIPPGGNSTRYIAPGTSGTRYAADDLVFHDENGKVTVNWGSRTRLNCVAKP